MRSRFLAFVGGFHFNIFFRVFSFYFAIAPRPPPRSLRTQYGNTRWAVSPFQVSRDAPPQEQAWCQSPCVSWVLTCDRPYRRVHGRIVRSRNAFTFSVHLHDAQGLLQANRLSCQHHQVRQSRVVGRPRQDVHRGRQLREHRTLGGYVARAYGGSDDTVTKSVVQQHRREFFFHPQNTGVIKPYNGVFFSQANHFENVADVLEAVAEDDANHLDRFKVDAGRVVEANEKRNDICDQMQQLRVKLGSSSAVRPVKALAVAPKTFTVTEITNSDALLAERDAEIAVLMAESLSLKDELMQAYGKVRSLQSDIDRHAEQREIIDEQLNEVVAKEFDTRAKRIDARERLGIEQLDSQEVCDGDEFMEDISDPFKQDTFDKE